MQFLKGLWIFTKNDVFGTDNKYIAISWIAAICGVLGMGFYLNSESVSFLGIAESRESNVNFEYPVEIKSIHVLNGQIVKKGDLILELNQAELNTRLRQLHSQLDKLNAEMSLREHLSSMARKLDQTEIAKDPLLVEIQELKNEIRYLETQRRNLFVVSEFDGVIGAVNFKNGERVPAFSPLVTVSPVNPSLVHGFVNENLHSKLQIGQKVSVNSLVDDRVIAGKIVSVGTRIVQVPERLLRLSTLQAWGREVVVQIPNNSGLLLGEKVQIKPKFNMSFIAQVQADDNKTLDSTSFSQVALSDTLYNKIEFEPSGLIYLEDFKKFLVVSDDLTTSNIPSLLLMDENGQIHDDLLPIEDMPKMRDIESISQVGTDVYLLSSLSANKHGEHIKSRQLFAHIQRTGLNLKYVTSVDLKSLLLKAFEQKTETFLKKLTDLEIESHVIVNDSLILGIKDPKAQTGEVVLLQINDFKKMLKKNELDATQVSVFKLIKLQSEKLTASVVLTDIALNNHTLYLASSCVKTNNQTDNEHKQVTKKDINNKCSAVWSLNLSSTQEPKLIAYFEKRKLEGLTYVPTTNSLVGIFDRDGKDTQKVTIPLPSLPPSKP